MNTESDAFCAASISFLYDCQCNLFETCRKCVILGVKIGTHLHSYKESLSMMKNSSNFLTGIALIATIAIVVMTKNIKAGFEPSDLNVHVMVGDVEFGSFDEVKGLDQISSDPMSRKRIVLKRNFVTDPSFYIWARGVAEEHQGPKNVKLVYKDSSGNEVSRLTLKASQPLAWTVEAADPSLGGFHERIELAVQKVIKDQ